MLRRRAPRSAGRTRAFQRRWFPRVSFSAGGFPMVGGAKDEEAIGISLGDIVETTGTGFWVFVEIDLNWYWVFFFYRCRGRDGSDTISANDALPRIGYVFI
jgi:hypothetical protein